MNALKYVTAALVVAVPLAMSIAPAEALTSKQYAAQGRGHYVSSKGRGTGYRSYGMYHHHWYGHRRYHRHY